MNKILDFLDRNYNIVKSRMITHMKSSLEFGKELIDSELNAGVLDFIVKPIVKSFYEIWVKNDVKNGTLSQINTVLDAAAELVREGNNQETFDGIVEREFPKYLKADQTYRNCKKDHKNYKRLEENTKQTFVNYLKRLSIMLSVNEDLENYEEIYKIAFKTEENARNHLLKQLEFTEKGIEVVEEDPSILSIPIGKRIAIDMIRKGFEKVKSDFLEGVNSTFNNPNY